VPMITVVASFVSTVQYCCKILRKIL